MSIQIRSILKMRYEKPFNWKQMTRLLKYIKPYSKTLLPAAFGAVLINMIVRLLVQILIGQYVVDRAIINSDYRLLIYLIVIVVGLYFINYLANHFRIKIVNVLGQRTIHDLRKQLFTHVQYLSHISLINVQRDQFSFVF